MPDTHYQVDLEGYRELNGNRVTDTSYADVMGHIYGGGIDGVFVHVHDPKDPEDSRWFWVYHLENYTDWEDAWEHIDDAAAQYGLEV